MKKQLYKIKVKKYMTRKSTPYFDFMKKYNNDEPMPLRIMFGEITKETKGMVFMNLYGDIDEDNFGICVKCGATITNPVSRYFGMGPYCGGHQYINPFSTEEELLLAIKIYRTEYLNNIKWSGWIPKSAILEQKRVIY